MIGEIQIFNLEERKAKRAATFYSQYRQVLNSKSETERIMYLGGIIDMDRVRKATRVEAGTNYRYCQTKFLTFCARHFGTTVTDLKKQFTKSLTNN